MPLTVMSEVEWSGLFDMGGTLTLQSFLLLLTASVAVV